MRRRMQPPPLMAPASPKKRKGQRKRLHQPALIIDAGGAIAAPRTPLPRTTRRNRPKRRRWLPSLITRLEPTLWLLVGSVLMISLWASPRMQPNRIVLHGVPPAARSDIEARLRQLWQQQPYSLRVGTGRVQHAMEQFDWVAQAQVHPRFPTHLVISLQSRQPFVEVRCTPPTAGKTFIDPAGIVFSPPNPPLQAPGGVILLSEGVAPPPAGALQQGSPLWRAFALLRILSRHEGAAQYVRTVSIGRGNELTLTCRAEGGTAMRFRLGDAMPYEQQAQLIAQLLQNASPSLAQWEYVDLKSPSYPAVKPMSNSVLRGNTTP